MDGPPKIGDKIHFKDRDDKEYTGVVTRFSGTCPVVRDDKTGEEFLFAWFHKGQQYELPERPVRIPSEA